MTEAEERRLTLPRPSRVIPQNPQVRAFWLSVWEARFAKRWVPMDVPAYSARGRKVEMLRPRQPMAPLVVRQPFGVR